jgi:rare lipoprotein A
MARTALTSLILMVQVALLLPLLGWSTAAGAPAAHQARNAPEASAQKPSRPRPPLDRSGRPRIGKASFYAGHFTGRTMADGTRMDPQDDNAASRTLPLGTRARVTNLKTGRSAIVTIQDRGPYTKGRIIDLSPATARKIGIRRKAGVALVRVTPLSVPMPDGQVKQIDDRTRAADQRRTRRPDSRGGAASAAR